MKIIDQETIAYIAEALRSASFVRVSWEDEGGFNTFECAPNEPQVAAFHDPSASAPIPARTQSATPPSPVAQPEALPPSRSWKEFRERNAAAFERAHHDLEAEALPVQGEPIGEVKRCYDDPSGIEVVLYGKATSDVPGLVGTKLLAAPQPAAARVGLSQAAQDVLAERERQITAEGWTPEHDDGHRGGGLGFAAACYALAGVAPDRVVREVVGTLWPWTGWASKWWKPKDRRHNLVRACALALAELERQDRAHGIASPQAGGGEKA